MSWGGGVGCALRPNTLKKCMKLYWNFQRGGGLPSMGDVWIFSGTTQSHFEHNAQQ